MKLCYVVLIVFTALFTGCNKPVPSANAEQAAVTVPDSLLPADCIPKNFTTPLGTKVMYTRVGNAMKLSWGDGTYTRSHDSLFTCTDSKYGGRWDWIPKYESETKHYLIFSNVLSASSGGNPAPIDFTVMVLPKSLKDSIYEKEMFIGIHNEYVIYIKDWTADSLTVLNIESKKAQLCVLNPKSLPFNRSPAFNIKKTNISNRIFTVEYEALDERDSVVTLKNKFNLHL